MVNDRGTKEYDDLFKVNAGRLRSMDRIVNALFELMKSRSYDEISVTDICEAAGVSRKTFYRSFETKIDVLGMKIDRVYMDCADRYGFAESGARSIYMYFYEYMLKDSEFANLFINPQLFDLMTEKIKEYVEIELEDTWYNSVAFEPRLAEYYLNFAAIGIASLMRTWVQNGRKIPPKTMAALSDRLLSGVIS